jgi:hypothetical protein
MDGGDEDNDAIVKYNMKTKEREIVMVVKGRSRGGARHLSVRGAARRRNGQMDGGSTQRRRTCQQMIQWDKTPPNSRSTGTQHAPLIRLRQSLAWCKLPFPSARTEQFHGFSASFVS